MLYTLVCFRVGGKPLQLPGIAATGQHAVYVAEGFLFVYLLLAPHVRQNGKSDISSITSPTVLTSDAAFFGP